MVNSAKCMLLNYIIMKLNIQVQKLDLIFLSDIHNNSGNLEKLASHVQSNSLHFDYCLVGGDIVNCDHINHTHNEEQEMHQFRDILTFLQNLFQCKVIFIPGNHDPLAFLNTEQHISPDIVNVHKKEHVLELGLSLVGLGGSLPAYTDIDYTKKVWEGFPYQTEEDFEKDIQTVFYGDQLNTSKIYLTHMGPALSSTSLDRRGKEKPIFAGSKSLDKVDEQQNLIVHLHGHVHGGAKYDMFNSKPIVNPGAFSEGNYSIIKLSRLNKAWKLTKVSFLTLL